MANRGVKKATGKAKRERRESRPQTGNPYRGKANTGNRAGQRHQKNDSVRRVAVDVLVSLQKEQGSLATLLPTALERVPEADRALLQELCYGVCRWFFRLQSVVAGHLEKPLRNKDVDVHTLLLMGVYQLDHMRIAQHAAINLSVEAAQQLNKPWARGLVNAVLRSHQRDLQQGGEEPGGESGETAVAAPANLPANPDLSDEALYAHPPWMIKQLKVDWPDAWQSLLVAANQRPPMVLRVNQSQISTQDYRSLLHEAGIEHQLVDDVTTAVQLNESRPVLALPGFDRGQVSVQDGSAQLACQLLLPELKAATQNSTILDACAAPGGKTCHLLEASKATVVAMDISELRLQRVTENLQRLGFSFAFGSGKDLVAGAGSDERVSLLVADAALQDKTAESGAKSIQYDIVLVDAPCSGSGIIRRQPDIKLLRKPGDLKELAEQQLKIVDSLWSSVKPGGKLLYVTCSIFKQENVGVMKQFLANQQDVTEVDLGERSLGLLVSAEPGAGNPGAQMLTGVNGMDGFYYCLLHKNNHKNAQKDEHKEAVREAGQESPSKP